ncbi:MAG: ArsR/SmtB family transcription factor [Sphingomonadales bacterium]
MLDTTFHALADPTRRTLLSKVVVGRQRVTDLAAEFPMSLNAVSKHIQVLERAGLVVRERVGRTHFIDSDLTGFAEVQAWLSQMQRFWAIRLDQLGDVVEQGE